MMCTYLGDFTEIICNLIKEFFIRNRHEWSISHGIIGIREILLVEFLVQIKVGIVFCCIAA